MDYSHLGTQKKLERSSHLGNKIVNKIALICIKALLIAFGLAVVFGISFGIGVYKGIADNTPDISMDTIVSLGYASNVYNAVGELTDTLVMAGSNRQEATYEELPENLINAFVAIEDSRFWEHNGIDMKAIFRAAKGVLTSDSSGGGSTITQQLIKNNVFNGGREKGFGARLERKIQEQVLAVELEKTMDKKIILTNYLNTINLGNNCLGVKVAARRYFNKDISDLTLSECAVIAGITQNPSKFNPITHPERNAEKRKIILDYMEEQGYITTSEKQAALDDPVYDRIQNVEIVSQESTKKVYSYYTDELIDQVMEALTEELGYSETQAHNLLYSGGLSIYTAQDPAMQAIVDKEINDPENYPETRYALSYRLSVLEKDADEDDQTHYSEKGLKNWCNDKGIQYPDLFSSEEEAKELIDQFKKEFIKPGDKITGESISMTLEPQTSFVLIEQSTGNVKAISGGRGQKSGSLSFSRAGDSLRQPGSTFKVITAFAPALDACDSTLATTYYDAPYTVGKKTFRNWYSSGHAGWSNIRDGIIYSMNIIAVRCLCETVTPDIGVQYARKFGITSLTEDDYNPATALGGITYGVSNLELTGAYAAIANKGLYKKPRFFTKIVDHSGKVILSGDDLEEHRVLDSANAFLLTDAMRESMIPMTLYGTSISSTSTAGHLDNMSCAGKSGTTTNSYDLWFEGFTPYYTGGIWTGYDNNESTLNNTASFHKVIWKKIMDQIHTGYNDPGFSVPDGIVQVNVCRKSGKLATARCAADPRGSAVYAEYFKAGTEPVTECDCHTPANICSESHGLATEFCPNTETGVLVRIPENEAGEYTADSPYSVLSPCTIHSEMTMLQETGDANAVPSPYGPGGPVSDGSAQAPTAPSETIIGPPPGDGY